MTQRSPSKLESGCPEFAVRYETISGFFKPPLARSTFHDKVQAGTIIPLKGIRGFYKLNESLRRMGLREVRSEASWRSDLGGRATRA